MSVAETSKEAYRKLKKLGDKQQQVFDCLGELGIACDLEIAESLGWPVNRVTGRRDELITKGYVVQHGYKRNRFGSNVKAWCVTDPYAQKKIDLTSDPADDIKEEKWSPAAISWLAD